MSHIRWFVGFTALRHRRKPRRIRFDQQPVRRHFGGHIPNVFSVLERHNARNGDVEPLVKGCLPWTKTRASSAVPPRHPYAPAAGLRYLSPPAGYAPRQAYCGEPRGKLQREGLALSCLRAGAVSMQVIQSGFPNRYNAFVSKLCLNPFKVTASRVRVDSGSRPDIGITSGQSFHARKPASSTLIHKQLVTPASFARSTASSGLSR